MPLTNGVFDPITGDTTIVTPISTIVVHSAAHHANVDYDEDDSEDGSTRYYPAPTARVTRSRASLPGPGSLPLAGNVAASASSSASPSGSGATTAKKRARTTSTAAPSPASAQPVGKGVTRKNDTKAQAPDDVEGDSQPVASSSVRAGKKSTSAGATSNGLSHKRVKIDRTRSRSKKTGEPAQSAEPQAPQPTRPSVHLAVATANLSAQDFHRLAVEHLFPLLDTIPPAQSRLISDAFDAAVLQAARQTEQAKELLVSIDHDKHEKELAERVQAMLKLIRRDPSHDDIGDEMHGVALHAIAWLNKLFIVGVEHRMYLNEVFQGFRAVYSTIDQVYAAEARTGFAEIDDIYTEYRITNEAGKVLYRSKRGPLHIVAKFCRDFMCTVIALGHDPLTNTMLRVLKETGLEGDMLQVVRISDAEQHLAKRGDFGEPFDDAWFTKDMKDALPKLASLCCGRDMDEFTKSPSVSLYRKIRGNYPSLVEKLDEIVNTRLKLETGGNEDYLLGIEVYSRPEADKVELISLIEKMNEEFQHEAWAEDASMRTLRTLAQDLSLSSAYRQRVCLAVRDAVRAAQAGVIEQLYYDMPELEDEVSFLEDALRDNRIPKTGGTPQQKQSRQKAIEKVCARAVQEPPVGHRPDVAGSLRKWRALVNNWPNEKERHELRASTASDPNDSELGSMEGLVDTLIRHLGCSYRDYLADGLELLFTAGRR